MRDHAPHDRVPPPSASCAAPHVNPAANRMGGAEDFARVLKLVPGNFANIGNGGSAVCHSPHYDFNDGAPIHGVRYFTALTRSRLEA